MNTLMLINCTHCHTALQLPPGAAAVRCALCQAVTHVGDPRALAGVPQPPPYHHYYPPTTPTNGYVNHYYPLLPPPPQPSPEIYAPPPPPPVVHSGQKKAVIVGIAYKNTKSELKGCINDAKCMKYMLVNRFKFPESAIIMLTEEETDTYKIPTKQNIRMAMKWLVQGCQPGDSLVFHFSGHGGQQKNLLGDEIDGYDETICPLDYEKQGMIVDDEINDTIVKPLVKGVKLHAIIDSCHSGTVLDLNHLCRMDRMGRTSWEDHSPKSGAWKGTSGGEAISFSGCDDDQTSADTSAMSKVTSTGAMTFAFIKAIEKGQGTTYGNLLHSMRSTIRQTNEDLGVGSMTTLLAMLLTGGSAGVGLTQEPQLSANEPFDIYSKPFSL